MMQRLGPATLSIGIGLLAGACGSSPATGPTTTAGSEPNIGAADGPAAEPDAGAPAVEPTQIVRVTIVSGEIEGKMPNGEEWDGKDEKSAHTIDKSLALYVKRHPELTQTTSSIGIPIDAAKLAEEARRSSAADPMVIVQVDDVVFRSPMRPRAFNPVWDFTLQFPVGPGYSARDTTVRVQVVDYDGPTRFDTLGSTVISVDELLAKPLHQLGAFGSVKQLTVEVATIEVDDPKPEPSVFRIAVPGNAKWTDTGVELTAGQRVAIDAADEVCTSGEKLSACSGPEGQRKTSSYNLPGFDSLGHGALVAALGDTRFSIGRDRTFIAPSSGRLRLGVNDTKSDDNRGAYAVRIKVDSGL